MVYWLACRPLIPTFAGSNPVEAVGFFWPFFGGEVKPSVPCRRFAARKRSLNGVEKASLRHNYRTPFSLKIPPFDTRSARVVGTWGIWRRKWERLKTGESNGKLPLRCCPECSVPETYRSPDLALVPAKTGPRDEY
jgi:hypothetical protein